jgi:hypothetical protein
LYGKSDLLPDCAVEPDFWRRRTYVARQADAGVWAVDVPVARTHGFVAILGYLLVLGKILVTVR